MKRKILAVVLTLAMVVCYMPTMAFAASHTNCQPGCNCEAAIGGTHYDTLAEAAQAASDNWTKIKLLKRGGIEVGVNPSSSESWIKYSTDISLGITPASSKAIYFGGVSDAWTYGKGSDSKETIKDLNITGSDYEAELTFASSSKSNIHFATVEGAFAAVKELPAGTDSTITLVKNADIETGIEVESGDKVTLDLNGKTLTSRVATGNLFTVAGDLTVKGTGNSKVAGGSVNAVVNFYVSGKLEIKSGTFETRTDPFIAVNGTDSSAILAGGSITYNGASSTAKGINVQSGTVVIGENGKTTGPSISGYVTQGSTNNTVIYADGENSSVYVYGGEIGSNNVALWVNNKASAKIYDGTFSRNSTAAKSTGGADLEILGGSFTSSGDADFDKDGTSSLKIYGGTFKHEPKPGWMGDYYGTKSIGSNYVVCDKVELFVTVEDKVYDGAPFVPDVYAEYLNPLKNVERIPITDAVFNYTWAEKDKAGTINQPSKVGEYSVVVDISSADQKYIAQTSVEKNFKITPQQLFLVAEDKTVKLGDEAPTFTFKAALQSDGSVFTTTEPTYKAFVDSLNNTNIELKDSEGEAITLENALKTVGEYKIYVKASVPTNVDTNYDILINKAYDGDAANKQKDYCGTLKVEPRAPEKYGFDLGASASTDKAVALAEGVITDNTIKALTDKNTGTGGVDLVLDATLIDPDAEAVQVPLEQAKALYDYMNASATKNKVTGLTFKFAGGQINLDKAALSSIYTNAGTTADFIEVSAKSIAAADVNSNNDLKVGLEDVEGIIKVLDLKINSKKAKSGSETADPVVKSFTSFGSGTATVSTPLKTADNKKGTDYSVYYLDPADAELTDMEAEFTKSGDTPTPAPAYEEGTLEFETNHLSYYVVCETIKDKVCDGKLDCPSFQFYDLEIYDNPAVWYHEFIDYVVENEIMNGVSTNSFAPRDTVTRAMVVTMIYRMAGEPVNVKGTPFEDIDATQWYGKAVKWAYNNNVIKGLDDTHFGPNEPVTREQLATILYRYYTEVLGFTAEKATTAEMNKFADVAKVSSYAEDAMKWAVKSGIIGGEQSGSDLNLKPGDGTLRQEIAKMITVFDRDIIKAKKKN